MITASLNKINNSDRFMLRLWQSGRELFHSNVLASLIEEPHYGPCLLKIITGDSNWSDYEIRCLREKWRIDILVVAKRKQDNNNAESEYRVVAIENKFKSLPDIGQLMRYGQKLDKDFIPLPPSPYQENCSRVCQVGHKLLNDLMIYGMKPNSVWMTQRRMQRIEQA